MCFADVKAVRPSTSAESISRQAKNKSLSDTFYDKPIYNHWFALELYRAYLLAQEQVTLSAPDINLTFCSVEYKIERSRLDNAIAAIAFAASLQEQPDANGFGILSSSPIRSQELTFSSLYARALDRFLFRDESVGACLHQGPVRKEGTRGCPEASDVYVIPLRNFKPGTPLLVSDIKTQDYDTALKETSLYASCCVNHVRLNDETCPLILGLPVTRAQASLYLYVSSHRKMWGIKVIGSNPPHDSALLCTVYAAVNYLCRNPTFETHPLVHPIPFKGNGFSPLGSNGRSFLKQDTRIVRKIFDTLDNRISPNIKLMESVGYSVTGVPLSSDQRFVYIKYSYLDGDHSPTLLKQFAGVTHMLHKVHEKGYVHGDIRLENIVFSSNGSHLIDFDLAKNEGRLYPEGYCWYQDIRHNRARQHLEMKREHDRYSLGKSMQEVKCTDCNKQRASSIIQRVTSQESLGIIANDLEKLDF